MSAFKQLYKSDITVTPYTANKLWSFSYNDTPNDSYITYDIGQNSTYSLSGPTTTNGEYESSIYALVNQLYYQNFTASLNTQSLAVSNYYESASSQRPTSSYYKYDIVNNFPSSSGDRIGVIGISTDLYGNNVLPYSFLISSSLYTITDDGYGNIYDVSYIPTLFIDNDYVNPFYVTQSLISSSILVGNIFYSQGTCVITNQNYINILLPTLSSSIDTLFSGSTFTTDTAPYVYSFSQNYNMVYASGSIINKSTSFGNLQIVMSGSVLYEILYPNFLAGQTASFFVSSSVPNGSQFILSSGLFIDSAEANFVLYAEATSSTFNPVNISFKNNYNIQETEVRCIIKESEFNASYNPSIQDGVVTNENISGSIFYYNDGTLKDFATGSDFSPYVTSIGLYNDDDDLLAVAKLAKPLLISPNTDMTFIVKYDI